MQLYVKNMTKTLIPRQKVQWMVYGKIAKGLPPLRIPTMNIKAQEKEDEILKLYEA